jgi:hypothetical protein
LKGQGTKTRDRFKTSPEYKQLVQEDNQFKRRILFVAILTRKLKEKGADAILVDGEAIDLYTAGTFATSDIDLVISNKALTEKLLNRFGFSKEANGLWLGRELNIVVQLILEPYTGNAQKLKTFRVKDVELKVAAPEDLIRNRLYSLKFWKGNQQLDLEQSVSLLRIFSNELDNAYLEKIAKENDIVDVLAEARQLASRV